MNDAHNASNELAERLRRWIVVGGYTLGCWVALQNALMLLAWGPVIFNRAFRFMVFIPIHRLAVTLWLASPLLLLVGCWGFDRRRRWARPVLLTYAGAAVAGLFATQALRFADIVSGSGSDGDQAFAQVVVTALRQFDLAIWASVFPAFVYLSLGRPEVRQTFPEFRRGFTPILRRDRS